MSWEGFQGPSDGCSLGAVRGVEGSMGWGFPGPIRLLLSGCSEGGGGVPLGLADGCSLVAVETLLDVACSSALPGGGTNQELALHCLCQAGGNVMVREPPTPWPGPW